MIGESTNGVVDSLLGPPQTESYRPTATAMPAWYALGQSGRAFDLSSVELMLTDPTIALGLAFIKAPITTAEGQWRVVSDDPLVADFVDQQLRRLWRTSLDTVLGFVEYGYSGSEVMYRRDEMDGMIHFDYLRALHPSDIECLSLRGEYAGIRVVGGERRGKSIGNIKDLDGPGLYEGRPTKIPRPAKGFWVYQGSDYNVFYGRSRCVSSWLPWKDKTGRDGMNDIIRMWYYKNAFHGVVVRHPEKDIRLADGSFVDARSMARQLAEWIKSGAVIALPNTRDPKTGEYHWSIEWPGFHGNADGLLDALRMYDEQELRGLHIPDNIILETMGGAGGSMSGRKVPEDAFYSMEEKMFHAIIHAFDHQVNQPTVLSNFGSMARYRIETMPIVPIRQQEMAQREIGKVGGPAGAAAPQPSQSATPLLDAISPAPGGEAGQAQSPENRPGLGMSLTEAQQVEVDKFSNAISVAKRRGWSTDGLEKALSNHLDILRQRNDVVDISVKTLVDAADIVMAQGGPDPLVAKMDNGEFISYAKRNGARPGIDTHKTIEEAHNRVGQELAVTHPELRGLTHIGSTHSTSHIYHDPTTGQHHRFNVESGEKTVATPQMVKQAKERAASYGPSAWKGGVNPHAAPAQPASPTAQLEQKPAVTQAPVAHGQQSAPAVAPAPQAEQPITHDVHGTPKPKDAANQALATLPQPEQQQIQNAAQSSDPQAKAAAEEKLKAAAANVSPSAPTPTGKPLTPPAAEQAPAAPVQPGQPVSASPAGAPISAAGQPAQAAPSAGVPPGSASVPTWDSGELGTLLQQNQTQHDPARSARMAEIVGLPKGWTYSSRGNEPASHLVRSPTGDEWLVNSADQTALNTQFPGGPKKRLDQLRVEAGQQAPAGAPGAAGAPSPTSPPVNAAANKAAPFGEPTQPLPKTEAAPEKPAKIPEDVKKAFESAMRHRRQDIRAADTATLTKNFDALSQMQERNPDDPKLNTALAWHQDEIQKRIDKQQPEMERESRERVPKDKKERGQLRIATRYGVNQLVRQYGVDGVLWAIALSFVYKAAGKLGRHPLASLAMGGLLGYYLYQRNRNRQADERFEQSISAGHEDLLDHVNQHGELPGDMKESEIGRMWQAYQDKGGKADKEKLSETVDRIQRDFSVAKDSGMSTRASLRSAYDRAWRRLGRDAHAQLRRMPTAQEAEKIVGQGVEAVSSQMGGPGANATQKDWKTEKPPIHLPHVPYADVPTATAAKDQNIPVAGVPEAQAHAEPADLPRERSLVPLAAKAEMVAKKSASAGSLVSALEKAGDKKVNGDAWSHKLRDVSDDDMLYLYWKAKQLGRNDISKIVHDEVQRRGNVIVTKKSTGQPGWAPKAKWEQYKREKGIGMSQDAGDAGPVRWMGEKSQSRKSKKKDKPGSVMDKHWVTGEDVERPKMLTWIAGHGNEWVGYYNPTGHVMHFVDSPEKAHVTTDLEDAKEMARIAKEVYRRDRFSAAPLHLVINAKRSGESGPQS